MAESIGAIVAFILVYGIPWFLSKKAEARKREEFYNSIVNKDKNSYNNIEKWKK